MTDFAIATGLIAIDDALRQKFVKVIDGTKKMRNYGSVFAEPVDYVSMNLPDYPEVIRRPMDLQTLRSNLMLGEYTHFWQFVRDADLIWSNCRVYNAAQNESFFLKAADECEKFFLGQLLRIEELRLNQRELDAILQNPLPAPQEDDDAPLTLL